MSDFLGRTLTFAGNDLTTIPGLKIFCAGPLQAAKESFKHHAASEKKCEKRLPSAFFAVKVITVTIAIVRPSRSQLEQSLDTLWGMLTGKEQPLIVTQNTGVDSTRLLTPTIPCIT